MAIAHVLKPAPAQGAAQLFLLFSDAGQPWQGMRPLGEKLAAAFESAAIVVLQGPYAVGEGGAWLSPLAGLERQGAAADAAESGASLAPGEHAAPADTVTAAGKGAAAVAGVGVGAGVGAAQGGAVMPGSSAAVGAMFAVPSGQDASFSATALLDRMSEESLIRAVDLALPGCLGSIRAWQAKMKVLPEATALIGQGEGATMALAAALTTMEDGHPVCGRVSVVGGRYAAVPEVVSPALVLHFLHGKADTTVHFGHTVRAAEQLVKQDADVVADIVPHEGSALSDEMTGWLLDRFRTRVPRHLWQAAMRVQGADPDSCS